MGLKEAGCRGGAGGNVFLGMLVGGCERGHFILQSQALWAGLPSQVWFTCHRMFFGKSGSVIYGHPSKY